ncbi:MAG: histidine phosphatase family protein [Spirochaetes bacterium]|nr:histidine phosphatase family protein [Spirochaetota bacterium]
MISLPNLAPNTNFALIIRHAEREQITETFRALEALLTEKGKQEAVLLGKTLARFGNFIINHSPVQRCKQTAEKIAEGIIESGSSAQINGSLVELGGPYITGHWSDIVSEIDKRGFNGFVRAWFDGKLPETLIAPLDVSAKQQAAILRIQLERGDASYVNVSHDWNIMCLREYYFGIQHEDVGTPAYLDGLVAILDCGGMKLYCNGREKFIE